MGVVPQDGLGLELEQFSFAPKCPYRRCSISILFFSGYQREVWGVFPRGKAARAWSWPITSTTAAVKNEWSCTRTPPVYINDMQKRIFIFFWVMSSWNPPEQQGVTTQKDPAFPWWIVASPSVWLFRWIESGPSVSQTRPVFWMRLWDVLWKGKEFLRSVLLLSIANS